MANNILQKGWECPKCGAVMSPFTKVCINCRGITIIMPFDFTDDSNFSKKENKEEKNNGK